MQAIIWAVGSNTVIAAVIACVAFAVAKLNRWPALAHALWLLVIVKLLTPPLWHVEIAVDKPVTAGELTPVVVTSAMPVVAPIAAPVAPPIDAVHSASPPVAGALRPVVRSRELPWQAIAIAAWATIATTWLVIAAWRMWRFGRLLRGTRVAENRWADDVLKIGAKINLRRPPETFISSAAGISPMLVFFGARVRLVLPAPLMETLDRQQREAVIAHELAHLKRGDHWVRLFELLATAALWWHPLLWLARRGLHEAEEQCCDAVVVATLPEARRQYADALVDAMAWIGRGGERMVPAAATGLGRTKHLRRRLTMIVSGSPAASLSFPAKLCVVALLATLPITVVRGQAKSQPQPRAMPGRASAETAAPAAPASQPAVQTADDATRKALEALVETALDQNQDVARAASDAILRFGPRAVPSLVDAMQQQRTAAVAQQLLVTIGNDAVPPLVQSLQSPQPATRERSLMALRDLLDRAMTANNGFPGAPPMAPGLGAVGMAGADNQSATPPAFVPPVATELAAKLLSPAMVAVKDQNVAVRLAATKLLARIADADPDVSIVPACVAALKDEESQVRSDAAYILSRLQGIAIDSVGALASAVADPDANVRISALGALEAIGSDASDAMGAVTVALRDPNETVRLAAAKALGAMQGPAGAPPGAMQFPPGGAPGFGGGVAGAEGGAAPGASEEQQRQQAVFAAIQQFWEMGKVGFAQGVNDAGKAILQNAGDPKLVATAFDQIGRARRERADVLLKKLIAKPETKDVATKVAKLLDEARK
jgi:beta-lactamase regulating signal transducer with metallopeptidase domain/HEAT repeat protein